MRDKRKPGRNEPCPCKSGKKFKRCCGDEAKLASEYQAAFCPPPPQSADVDTAVRAATSRRSMLEAALMIGTAVGSRR